MRPPGDGGGTLSDLHHVLLLPLVLILILVLIIILIFLLVVVRVQCPHGPLHRTIVFFLILSVLSSLPE